MRDQFKALFALLPLVHSAAIAPRDQFHNDVIRFQKCDFLTRLVEGVGGWEMGQMAYWEHKDSTGLPKDRTVFDMSTRMEDVFYNDHGDMKEITWGGGADGGGTMWGKISAQPVPWEVLGTYVGYVDRSNGNDNFRFNCFIDKSFKYNETRGDDRHPYWGRCDTYIQCLQREALDIQIVATDEVTRAVELSPATDIYKKFDEVYVEKENSGLCKEDKLDLHAKDNKCTVQFQCNSNGNKALMNALREQLAKISTEPKFYREWLHDIRGGNNQCEDRGDCLTDKYETWRSVPYVIQIAANTIKAHPTEHGTQAAFIKAIVECERDHSATDTICDVLGSLFSAGGTVKRFSAIAGYAGIATEIGCTIAKAIEKKDG